MKPSADHYQLTLVFLRFLFIPVLPIIHLLNIYLNLLYLHFIEHLNFFFLKAGLKRKSPNCRLTYWSYTFEHRGRTSLAELVRK